MVSSPGSTCDATQRFPSKQSRTHRRVPGVLVERGPPAPADEEVSVPHLLDGEVPLGMGQPVVNERGSGLGDDELDRVGARGRVSAHHLRHPGRPAAGRVQHLAGAHRAEGGTQLEPGAGPYHRAHRARSEVAARAGKGPGSQSWRQPRSRVSSFAGEKP